MKSIVIVTRPEPSVPIVETRKVRPVVVLKAEMTGKPAVKVAPPEMTSETVMSLPGMPSTLYELDVPDQAG